MCKDAIDKQKKGLVIVYDPHNLYQFLWYYSTYGKNIAWDALCLPNASQGTYMDEYCNKVGIFEQIFTDEKEYSHINIKSKIFMFLKMLGYALCRQQKKYARKILNSLVDNIDIYKEIVVLTDVGMISGISLLLGDEKEITILEDGVADYVVRDNINLVKNLFNLYDWQGYLVAKMGYSNVGHRYPLKTTRLCNKFCSNPQYMSYRQYKRINKLFEMDKTDVKLFDMLVEKIYPEIKMLEIQNVDTVVFSATIQSFANDYSKYVKKIEKYVSDNSNNVLLKKHPRDEIKYNFGQEIKLIEVPSSIPAEVLLRYIKGKKLIFCSFSATLFYLDSKENEIEIIYLKELHDECVKEGHYLVYDSLNTVREHLREIHMEDVHIEVLE